MSTLRRLAFFVCSLIITGDLTTPCAVEAGFGGRVALYSDAGLSQCSLADTGPGVSEIHVVHELSALAIVEGVTGISFRLVSSAGFTGTWVEDIVSPGMAAAGGSQVGTHLGYGGCKHTDVMMLRVRYQLQGTSTSCSSISATAYPELCCIVTSTCNFIEFPVDDGVLIVNGNQSCPCGATVATKPSTWGRIKAMYRD